MSLKTKSSFFLKLFSISLFLALFGLFSVYLETTANAQAQKTRPNTVTSYSESAAAQQAPYGDYKGVRIGMSQGETRAKLGQPTQAGGAEDFYIVSDTETVQIVFDATHRVTAISIDYLSDKSGAPDYKAIVGSNVQVSPDGSIYKLVRYEQLGFWVSFNRTAAVVPVITVTIQKLP